MISCACLTATLLLFSQLVPLAHGNLIITEVADKGTADLTICNGNGNDWIEIFNSGPEAVDLHLEGYILYDDKGILAANSNPFSFAPNTTIASMDYLIVCTKDGSNLSPSFGIGGDNREYQRWRRDDGFRWVDLEDTLNTSEFVLCIDWRE